MISNIEMDVEFISMDELWDEAAKGGLYDDLLKSIDKFSCGNVVIDKFVKEHAKTKSLELQSSKTKLLFNLIDKALIGYYSISAECLLSMDEYNQKPIFVGPAIRINMFAIASRYQGLKEVEDNEGNYHTWASTLFDICLKDIEKIAKEDLGVCFIILSATEKAKPMYVNLFEFEELDEDYILAVSEKNRDCLDMYRTVFEY